MSAIEPDILSRLREACVGHPHARIPWPHRLLHDAIAKIERLQRLATPDPERVTGLKCEDCRRPYGKPGFPDLVIPNADWKRISTTQDEGGLLCPSCICARLECAGIETTGRFRSGPLAEIEDPERVTGRVRWEDGDAYLGRVRIGTINALTSKPLKYGVDTRWVTVPGYFDTEASARAALVAAVKEAIGDE